MPQLEKMLEEARSHHANTKGVEKWLLSKCCASGVSHWSLTCGGQSGGGGSDDSQGVHLLESVLVVFLQ